MSAITTDAVRIAGPNAPEEGDFGTATIGNWGTLSAEVQSIIRDDLYRVETGGGNCWTQYPEDYEIYDDDYWRQVGEDNARCIDCGMNPCYCEDFPIIDFCLTCKNPNVIIWDTLLTMDTLEAALDKAIRSHHEICTCGGFMISVNFSFTM